MSFKIRYTRLFFGNSLSSLFSLSKELLCYLPSKSRRISATAFLYSFFKN